MTHTARIRFLVLSPHRSTLFLRWALKGFRFPAVRKNLGSSFGPNYH